MKAVRYLQNGKGFDPVSLEIFIWKKKAFFRASESQKPRAQLDAN